MILDTTYFLPMVGIGIEPDILRACLNGRTKFSIDDVRLSLISVFELQAKAAKLRVGAERVAKGVRAILQIFDVIEFYRPDIIRVSFELRRELPDYIDCVIVATAVSLGEDLLTEDRLIHGLKDNIKQKYGIRIYSHKDVLRP